jgi:hypothetical protein
MKKEVENYGRAYAFFDCRASKIQIEAELPTIREYIKTPSKLELFLTEGVENLNGNKKLMVIAQEAKDSGMKYVLEAKYGGAKNKKTADEVASILNQAYQSPLYADKEEFRGSVVYQDRKKYIFRE